VRSGFFRMTMRSGMRRRVAVLVGACLVAAGIGTVVIIVRTSRRSSPPGRSFDPSKEGMWNTEFPGGGAYLKLFGEGDRVIPDLEGRIKDGNSYHREKAARVLSLVGGPKAVDILRSVRAQEEFAGSFVRALGTIPGQSAEEELIRILAEPGYESDMMNDTVRYYALDTLRLRASPSLHSVVPNVLKTSVRLVDALNRSPSDGPLLVDKPVLLPGSAPATLQEEWAQAILGTFIVAPLRTNLCSANNNLAISYVSESMRYWHWEGSSWHAVTMDKWDQFVKETKRADKKRLRKLKREELFGGVNAGLIIGPFVIRPDLDVKPDAFCSADGNRALLFVVSGQETPDGNIFYEYLVSMKRFASGWKAIALEFEGVSYH